MTEQMRERYRDVVHTALYHPARYVRGAAKVDLVSMLAFIVHQHRMGAITEGQAARATMLDRVTIREIADRMSESDDAQEVINDTRV